MKGTPPRNSWRQKEHPRRKECPLETLGNKKNTFQRFLETKGTPPGGKMDFWKQLIRNPPVNHKI
ncbi:hypothetical protein GLOIN_2v1777390 [Rhizophagus irregularis DAOM 181602=DAOM 197198]|uniref:Uncharacterized protein n=2 Tax=Rhizophagus irregularis TaxID=588596 RepID=A0A015II00_RHIIW|nr:hypothetical protein GLOIN_2v1777390 [Rhizophagus irregularis DAOM 181602=DAOM 197198]EXX56807.1 hypothetical protein RirG_212820 [Rhizophagus irregularis DAOM 197198w]POG69178.1 hypothetical protein GLOIN_2v1777390 [Rhizophagus irregularis DAOM 181602=DAOM 197198]|eukprot:XP_025176044.1 hypothetical protein GLOIN_2v1777390 [Rhizophagus irregularis DAOM 181602=DAOM 197198]